MKYFVIALAVFSLSACSTPQKSEPQSQPATVAVSASDRVSRLIASVHDEESLEAGFQAIVKADNPVKAAQAEVERVGRIYFKTEGFLKEYDAKLESISKNPTSFEEGALLTDEAYAKMMASWILREQNHARIGYIYARSLELINDRTAVSPEAKELRANAVLVNAAFKKEITRGGQNLNRLAMQELLGELIEVGNSFTKYQIANNTREGVSDVNRFNAVMNRYSFNSPREITRFYARNSRGLAAEVKRASADTSLGAEVQAITPDVQSHLIENFSSRTPQSAPVAGAVVYPTAGSAGNMIGSNFRRGRWALTFDDGPRSATTPTVVANLQRRNQKATFFLLAENASKLRTVSRAVRDAGMAMGNHSYSHPQLTKLGAAGLEKQISESTSVLAEVYGFRPKVFRCPYGACGGNGSNIRQRIADEGMVHVFWNVDSLDWQDKNPTSVYNRVKKQMDSLGRGIILFHDIHTQSVEASRMIMDDLAAGERAGTMRAITIPQAIDELNSAGGMQ